MHAPRNIIIVTKTDKTELQSLLFEDLELMDDARDQLEALEGESSNGWQNMINRKTSKLLDRLESVIAQRKSQLSEDRDDYNELYNASEESPGIRGYNPYSGEWE